VFTGVKTSTELLADRDLREARHPVAPVLGHAVEKLQAQAALPQWPAQLRGGGLVIDQPYPGRGAAIRVCPISRWRTRTATPAHGCTSMGRCRVGSLGGAGQSYDLGVGEALSIGAVYRLH
jgi:hypothetical protein